MAVTPRPAAIGRVLTEDLVVRNPDGSARRHYLPLAILPDKDTGHPHRPFPAVRLPGPGTIAGATAFLLKSPSAPRSAGQQLVSRADSRFSRQNDP